MKVRICDIRYLRYAERKLRTEIYKLLATTNCDIAKLCRIVGIDRSTYYKWFKQYEEFRNIIKKSRAEFRSQKRDNVISSLYRRAMGYMVTEVRETIKLNAEGEQIEKKIVYHKKYIKPSERAIKYFLENFDEDGYEIFPDNDDSVDDDDDDSVDDNVEYNEDTDPLCLRHTTSSVTLYAERQTQDVQGTQGVDNDEDVVDEDVVDEDISVDDYNDAPLPLRALSSPSETCFLHTTSSVTLYAERQTQDVEDVEDPQAARMIVLEKVKAEALIDADLQMTKHAKLREAVALVISESSPKVQKEVAEAIKNSSIDNRDFMIGLPNYYALRVALRIYEDKRDEYRKKHNIPFQDYNLKPCPVTFNVDEGTRRMNQSYSERMHDIPILEEAKALKKYIIAARKEPYYEGRIIRHKCYYGDIWD